MKKKHFRKKKPTQKSRSFFVKKKTKHLGNFASTICQALQPWSMKNLIAAGLLLLGVVVPTLVLAVPSVSNQTPTINALTALTTDNVVVNFNEAIKAASVTSSSFIVTGSLSGAHHDTPSVVGFTVTLDPSKDFEPGETVTVTLTTGIQNTSSEPLAAPQTWQFRVKSAAIASGYFLDSGQSLGSSESYGVTLGDVDGDGDLDAFVANGNAQPNRVWLNDGSGTFTDSSQSLGSSDSYGVTLGDVDGDGDLDAFVANSFSQANRVWLNDGSGTFTDSQSLGSFSSSGVTLGDVDGDGDLDALVGISDRVWLNDGSGTFTDSSQNLGVSSESVTLGDVDGDGDLDAFIAYYGNDNRVWLNDGSGTFTDSSQSLGSNSGNNDVTLGDVDGDGDLDAFVAIYSYGEANRVWLNDGSGTFTDSSQSLGSSFSESVTLGDVDGDGDLDAFVVNIVDNRVWLNDGSGTFTDNSQNLDNPVSGNSVTLGDVDGDGDLDAFVANGGANSVWLNNPALPTAPSAPTGLTATVISQTQINLSWTDNSSDETGFKIERAGSLITTTAADAISYSDSGLSCGTTYNYSVTATNGTGDSTAATVSATTQVCPASPNAPTSLSGSAASQTQINLSWTDNSSDEAGFKIEQPAGTVIHTTAVDAIDYIHTGLVCATTYDYEIKATNANGDSTAATASVTTQACPVNPASSDVNTSSGVNSNCTNQGNIISSSCNAGKQTLTGEIEVKENVSVAQVTFENNVDNNGIISNSTVGPDATLTGGKLTGTITNEGIIADANFVGAELSGGTLSGTIVNNSKVGGVIKNVQLAKGAILKGGRLGEQISGNPDDPALISNAKILPGTILSNVRISPTVELPKDVVLGEGVILPSTPPTLTDFGLKPEDIAKLDAEALGELEPAVFSTLSAEEIKLIPPEAFAALSPEQIAEIQKEALEGMTLEQFEQIPIETLNGLTSKNMGGLPIEIIAEFTPEHLDALDAKAFKAMSSKDVSKLFVNLDAAKITTKNAEGLVPENWQLDIETGALTAPVGAKLTLKTLPSTTTLGTVKLPQVLNLEKGLGLDGKGTPLMEGTQRSLEETNLEEFVLSQDEKGILQAEGTGGSRDILYSFIPDADNAIVVDTNKIPIGLSVGAGGFNTITTPEGIQYQVIPAPKDPVAFSQSVGGGEVALGKRGDVLVELPTQTRRGDAKQVVIMNPFVESNMSNTCVEISQGVVTCDDNRSGPRSSRRNPVPRLKVVYPDGTAQSILPTLLSPDIFSELVLQFDGVDSVVFNADGTFYILQKGQKYRIFPNYDVTTTSESEEESVEPSVVLNDDGTLKYTIAIEPLEETDNARQGRRGAREVMVFDPFVEPILDDTCVEMSPGEVICAPLW